MNKRDRIITYVAAILVGIYVGYSIHPKASETTEKQANDIRSHETTTTVKNSRGTVKTVVVRDVVDRTKTQKEIVIMPHKPVLSVSALASIDTSKRITAPVYGVSVSKEVFGPFTAGAFGLTNGTIGLSVGINF